MQPDQPTKQSSSKGYGKRPMWQWIVIYVVLAIIVYGVAFAIYRNHHKSSSASGGSSSSSSLY